MFGCYPSLNHYLPRRSRRSQTYAGLEIAKGLVTRDITRWADFGPQFSRSAKTAPREGFLRLDAGANFSSPCVNAGVSKLEVLMKSFSSERGAHVESEARDHAVLAEHLS